MASRGARDMAKRMKKPMAHDDTAQDKALVKKMVKPSAMKGAPAPLKLAAGGIAKARQGAMSSSGQQKKQTAPLKSPIGKVSPPKRARMAI